MIAHIERLQHRSIAQDHEALCRIQIRAPEPPWVISPAVACLSGLKSAPRKRVRGNPPRVQIPPPPPIDKAKRWPRHEVEAGVRGLGLIFVLIWLDSIVFALFGLDQSSSSRLMSDAIYSSQRARRCRVIRRSTERATTTTQNMMSTLPSL
jgi:hypothetical protein